MSQVCSHGKLRNRQRWPEAAALCVRIELKHRAESQNKRELAASEDSGTVLYRHLKL